MEEAEWERANRSTQMRMGWGTKHGVLGRKHSGGEESAHSHTKEEQSGRVNSERSEETAHSHTQEERSRECEEGETWGVGPQSHTGRAVQGVWRGREPRGVSPLRAQLKPVVRLQQSEVAERRRGQRGSSDPGHRVPWKALRGGLRLLVSMKNGTRHKVLSRAESQLVWGFKVSGCHSAKNKSQKRARDLWEAPRWPGEWPWPCWARDPLQRLKILWG